MIGNMENDKYLFSILFRNTQKLIKDYQNKFVRFSCSVCKILHAADLYHNVRFLLYFPDSHHFHKRRYHINSHFSTPTLPPVFLQNPKAQEKHTRAWLKILWIYFECFQKELNLTDLCSPFHTSFLL